MKKILSKNGYIVTEENNSTRAKELIQKNNFDIVVSDMQMPELTGLDLLKSKPEDVLFILVTGFGSIDSAVESMKKGDRLEVSTHPSKELFGEHGRIKRMALVSIKDTGKGITGKDLEKIFIPFYTKKKTGTGIGLAFSKKIIKDHGGFIRVKSQKNKGTCFLIYLPFEDHG